MIACTGPVRQRPLDLLRRSRPPTYWWTWCLVCLLLWVTCAAWAQGQEPPAGQPGVLLLESNRVVEGRIREVGDTYAVEQSAGSLVVSKGQVRFVGTDLRSVYYHLREQLPAKPTADDHVDLARWCLGYKLISEARFELHTGLELETDRDDIRRNLTKLDALLRKPLREPEKAKSETPAERLAKGLMGTDAERESLAGMSREAGQEFTRRIQPILMHNCTNSACHGPLADNNFKLTLVRQGAVASRAATEKNMLALLPYLDQDQPEESPLWKLLKSNHGARGRSIFLGPKGDEQLKTLQKWMLSLQSPEAAERVAEAAKKSARAIEQAGHTTAAPRWRKGGPDPRTTRKGAPTAAAEKNRTPLSPSTKPSGAAMEPLPAPFAEDAGEFVETADLELPAPGTVTPRTSRTTARNPSPASRPGVPEVDPIVGEKPPVEVIDLPPEDPFNPDEFNSQQRVKRKLNY